MPNSPTLPLRIWLALSLLTFPALLVAAPAQAPTLDQLMEADAAIFAAVHATDFPLMGG